MAAMRLCLVAVALAACVSGGLSTCSPRSCPRNETCCTTPEGGEGCCPYRDGICCLDGIHCCPSGAVCDEDHHRCIKVANEADRQTAFLELTASPNVSMSSNEHCPDGSTCPDASTCCMTTTKHYGCCPFQDGVCCRDLTHCCPSGTRCIGGGLCYRPRSENDIEGAETPLAKQAVIVTQKRREGVSACTGATCPRDETCCELAKGGEGCCPLRDAICCLDGVHCCPFGTVCDEERERCIDVLDEKKERVTFVELTTTAPAASNVSASNEHCPDGSTCPGITTCCMTPTKHYGCCPFQSAVCCRDLLHCCPYGTLCIEGGLCRRQLNDLQAARVQENEQVTTSRGCSGGQLKCGSDQTCCDKKDGSAGCCPMKNAVCCAGMDSCCPEGFVCSPLGCLKL